MTIDEAKEKILSLVEPYLASQNFDLIDLQVKSINKDFMIEILVDKPRGGISIGECAGVNRAIANLFEQENILKADYMLEVSSPGIDRPLTSVKDFLRSYGKDIVFYLNAPVDGKVEHRGIVSKVDNGHVYIKQMNAEVMIPIQFINKAKQVI